VSTRKQEHWLRDWLRDWLRSELLRSYPHLLVAQLAEGR
jgi:hypothetical protein